jgi:hypothetical protein
MVDITDTSSQCNVAANASPQCKKKRRCHNPKAPPFHAILKGEVGKSIHVTLDMPTADEECPLTIAPMADDELDFLPEVTFFITQPKVRKLQLPCGHAFGVMNLIYYFARSGMRCPCCRAGFKCKLNPETVPLHFRSKFVAKIDECTRDENSEQIQADEMLARSLTNFDDTFGVIETLTGFNTSMVNMSVYIYNTPTSQVPSGSLEFRLLNRLDVVPIELGVYYLSSEDRVVFRQQVLENQSVNYISLVAHIRTTTSRLLELGRTGIIPVRPSSSQPAHDFDIGRIRSIPAGDTVFDILNSSGRSHIRWRRLPNLVIIS